MDVAFLALGYKMGLEPNKVRHDFSLAGTIPYESERKYSAAFYNKNGKVLIAAKGAVEVILSFCDEAMDSGVRSRLNLEAVEARALLLATEGYRVLGVAGGEFDRFEKKEVYTDKDLPRLVFYGLVAFIDPLRPEARDDVEKCRNAGITVLMITGDHPATASTIALELGIAEPDEETVTGDRLTAAGAVDSPAFLKLAASTHVFARVTPIQKLHIQEMNHIHARNIVLLLMVFMQNVHVFNCRSEKVSTFKTPLSRNWILILGIMMAQGIHIGAMHMPFMQKVLRIEPITVWEWAEVLVLGVPLLIVMEIFKHIQARRHPEA